MPGCGRRPCHEGAWKKTFELLRLQHAPSFRESDIDGLSRCLVKPAANQKLSTRRALSDGQRRESVNFDLPGWFRNAVICVEAVEPSSRAVRITGAELQVTGGVHSEKPVAKAPFRSQRSVWIEFAKDLLKIG